MNSALATGWSDFFSGNGALSLMNYIDFLARIVLAVASGALIGLERERRMKNAGIRTHMTIAFTAVIVMLLSKYAFFDLCAYDYLKTDTSRLAHGVVSAIGFIGAGVIFIRKENPVGITTAAGMWATVGIGLAYGSGLYPVAIIGTVVLLVIQRAFKNHHRMMPHQTTGKIRLSLDASMDIAALDKFFKDNDIDPREINIEKKEDGSKTAIVSVFFGRDIDMIQTLSALEKLPQVESADVYPII